MEEKKVRLYGFSRILEFPCLCIGRKALVFKIQWSKVKKRFCTYEWVDDTEKVFTYMDNGCERFRFFGWMVIKGYHVE